MARGLVLVPTIGAAGALSHYVSRHGLKLTELEREAHRLAAIAGHPYITTGDVDAAGKHLIEARQEV